MARYNVAEYKEDRQNGFNMEWRMVKSERSVVACPNETFWAAWRNNSGHLKTNGFVVTKLAKSWEVSYDLPERGVFPSTWRSKPQQSQSTLHGETMRDDVETGRFESTAASNLRAETPDEYDRRRDFEEDGYGRQDRSLR